LSLTVNIIINIINTIVKLISIINITVRFISISNTIAKMSNSSGLSSPPQSEISLPTLPPLLSPTLQLRRTAKKPRLASTDSDLFTSGLFSCTLLETIPPTVQLRCLQPGCLYAPKPQLLSFNQTGNYWTHYYHIHPQLAEAFKPALKSSSSQGSHTSSVAKLFVPRLSKPNASVTEAFQTKYRALLLDFVVSNNLVLQVVDSQSHQCLIQHCNLTVLTISTSTLNQDLDQTFIVVQNALKAELQEHIIDGGRISITTDRWSAWNYKDFIAVTGHWISKD
jgi:hypothetical protein